MMNLSGQFTESKDVTDEARKAWANYDKDLTVAEAKLSDMTEEAGLAGSDLEH